MNPANHKTVFVLDHTQYFGISSEDPIEVDVSKVRGPGYIPLAPITKSLWTCSVEAAMEYCRIAWDIFPPGSNPGKLIRFVVSDSCAHSINSWSSQEQSLMGLANSLALLGAPPRNPEGSVLNGLNAAAEAVTECTEAQHAKMTSLTDGTTKILNNCRVICITSTRNNASIRRLEEIFQSNLTGENQKAVGSDDLMPINHCHLVLLNVHPNNTETEVTSHPLRDVSSILSSEVHSVKAGGGIAAKLANLILSHYDLGSTTVTGIPMKEEQNASSSANYDVEIYHHSAAHTSILKGNAADSALIRSQRDGAEYETMTLKWCTPRGSSISEMHNCIAMHRITPVDVNSRPSSCLINFLLNGRSVMLEMPRKAGGKMASHLLAAHGGDIFVHTLATARSVLEDPPSISEGCGGRVTDYRITDFGEFMRGNKLIPCRSPGVKVDKKDLPLNRMRERLGRLTKYWPLTISSTCIFNMKSLLEPLPTLIVKEELTDEEVVQCKQTIYSLIALEARNEPLPTPNMGQRGKGPKREEQYRVMWQEVETLIRCHCRSERHGRVLNCLLECRNKTDDDAKVEADKACGKEDKVELDQALLELDQLAKQTGPELVSRASVIRATTDSPLSPPPVGPTAGPMARGSRQGSTSIYSCPRTLLDVWTTRQNQMQRAWREARPEFVGRQRGEMTVTGGSIVKLYPHLDLGDRERPKPMVIEGESVESTA